MSWPWSYGSWIYNYICNHYLAPLMLWFRISIMAMCTTLCHKICQLLATDRWFSVGSPFSSTNKTDRHDITEILLKVSWKFVNSGNWWSVEMYNCVTVSIISLSLVAIKTSVHMPTSASLSYQHALLFVLVMNKADILVTGANPGFQARGAHLKKFAPSGGRRENVGGISCEKSRFYAKKQITESPSYP